MEKFMLIVREDLNRLKNMTNEERVSIVPIMMDWIKSIAESGNYVNGEPLGSTGRYVTRDSALSDGPLIQSKEGIAGYDIILAENIEQAVSIAQTCPLVQKGIAVREVRPIVENYK